MIRLSVIMFVFDEFNEKLSKTKNKDVIISSDETDIMYKIFAF